MTKERLGSLIIASEDSLYRVAKTLLRSNADCADAIQESIVKAFSNLHTLKNDRYAKTWLIRILKNECYAIMRKEKKLIPLESIPDTASYEAEDYTDLYLAVSNLPEDMRMAVILYYAEGFSIKEVAVIEDTTESAIKNRLYKARGRLKKQLAVNDAYADRQSAPCKASSSFH
ncbi:MAG: sigma-70 family RNA polymerase sigma factor [Eubacterium sp.]|jgi:RNA polymerase sigma-70 factor (ECF subfamily)|nr:sigma-70 family RNA polymerase sigma factor [Eubacterium sp.]